MAKWTEADLDTVNAAIRQAVGGRKVDVTFSGGGGSRRITYEHMSYSDLQDLRSQIINELRSASGKSRSVLARSRKGL